GPEERLSWSCRDTARRGERVGERRNRGRFASSRPGCGGWKNVAWRRHGHHLPGAANELDRPSLPCRLTAHSKGCGHRRPWSYARLGREAQPCRAIEGHRLPVGGGDSAHSRTETLAGFCPGQTPWPASRPGRKLG